MWPTTVKIWQANGTSLVIWLHLPISTASKRAICEVKCSVFLRTVLSYLVPFQMSHEILSFTECWHFCQEHIWSYVALDIHSRPWRNHEHSDTHAYTHLVLIGLLYSLPFSPVPWQLIANGLERELLLRGPCVTSPSLRSPAQQSHHQSFHHLIPQQ